MDKQDKKYIITDGIKILPFIGVRTTENADGELRTTLTDLGDAESIALNNGIRKDIYPYGKKRLGEYVSRLSPMVTLVDIETLEEIEIHYKDLVEYTVINIVYGQRTLYDTSFLSYVSQSAFSYEFWLHIVKEYYDVKEKKREYDLIIVDNRGKKRKCRKVKRVSYEDLISSLIDKKSAIFSASRINPNGISLGIDMKITNTKDIVPHVISWEKERKTNTNLTLESLRGKECKNGVKILAVNETKIRLPDNIEAINKTGKVIARCRYGSDGLKEVHTDRNVNGYAQTCYNNITGRKFKDNNGYADVDLFKILLENEEVTKVVLNYKYNKTGDEILFDVLDINSAGQWGVWYNRKLSSMGLSDIIKIGSVYVKYRFDEERQQYVVMTLCDVVLIPKEVSLRVREEVAEYTKKENKIKITGCEIVFSTQANKELAIRSDGIVKRNRNRDKNWRTKEAIRIPKDTEVIKIDSFIINDITTSDKDGARNLCYYKNGTPAFVALCQTDSRVYLDFGNINPKLENGFNIPLMCRGNYVPVFSNSPIECTLKTSNRKTILNMVRNSYLSNIKNCKVSSCGVKNLWIRSNKNPDVLNFIMVTYVNRNQGKELSYSIEYSGSEDLQEDFYSIVDVLFKLKVSRKGNLISLTNCTPCIKFIGNVNKIRATPTKVEEIANKANEVIVEKTNQAVGNIEKKFKGEFTDEELKKCLFHVRINMIADLQFVVDSFYTNGNEIIQEIMHKNQELLGDII